MIPRRAGAGIRLLVTLALLLSAVAGPLPAQQPFPYRLSSGRESVLLVSGVAILAAGVVVHAELDVLTPDDIAALDPADVNAFDRPATNRWSPVASNLSDGLLVVTIAAPLSLMAVAPGSAEPVTVGLMLGETVLLANGIGQLAKTAFRRTRPFVYNDDPEIPFEKKASKTARVSLPSGHAATAFASAVFLSTVYARLHPTSPARPWIWGGSLAAATAVGYLRYNAGKHFPTDVIAGAALGVAIGWAVPRMHEGDRVSVAVAPGADGTVVGLSLRF
jgi:membrane-associated phospholipid phosphatase